MASTWGPWLSTRRTSCPAWASAAPVVPPIAPAPKIVIVMVPSDLTHGGEAGQSGAPPGAPPPPPPPNPKRGVGRPPGGAGGAPSARSSLRGGGGGAPPPA